MRACDLLSDAAPLLLASVTTMAYLKVDQVMLGEWCGTEAVGVYAAAARLSELWYFVPAAINATGQVTRRPYIRRLSTDGTICRDQEVKEQSDPKKDQAPFMRFRDGSG